MNSPSPSSPWTAALSGLAAFALMMGIGRFAFTPILPMMQEDWGVSVAEGGWLASANYLGYLLGGLSALRYHVKPRVAIRGGLLAISACTLAMGFEHHFISWLVLRAVPGFASAWVMVYFSAWVLEKLAQAGRTDLGGVVYAGVGAGIIFAGLVCLALLEVKASSDAAWIVLGIASFLITAATWSVAGDEIKSAARDSASNRAQEKIPEFWRLVFCYGAFGLGYIIPATFLPIMAKQIIADPGWFGWAWPVFGVAAVLSTLLASKAAAAVSPRGIWIIGNLVMALGVLVPIVMPDLVGIVIAALCVGGTFMVNTMVGLQEARRVAGEKTRVLIAAMISTFGVGQIVGPMLVSWLVHYEGGFAYALTSSAIPLFLSAYALSARRGTLIDATVATTK